MADKIVIIKLDVQEAGASAQIQKLNTDLSKLTQGTNEYDLVLKKIAIQEDRLINIQAKRTAVQGNATEATKKALVEQERFNKAVGDSSVLSYKHSVNSINKEISELTRLRNTLDVTGDEYTTLGNKISILNQKLNSSQGATDGLIGNGKKGLSGVTKASGGATAAAMELGRVVSDAPYGIRGMANNVSQLASQLFYMAGQQVVATTATDTATTATNTATAATATNTGATVVATGATVTATGATIGFVGALKMMWSALLGPMGVLLAIQAVVAGLDFFYGANKKAEKSSEDLTGALEKQKEELKELTEEYEDYLKLKEVVVMSTTKDREMLKALVTETLDLTNSEERRSESLKKLIELYPKYFKGLKIDDIKELFNAEKNVNRVLVNKLKLQDALNKAEIIANNIQLEKIKIGNAPKGAQADLTAITKLYEEQKVVRDLIGVYAALNLELKETKDTKEEEVSIIPRESVKALSFSDIAQRKKEMLARLQAIADAVGVDLKKDPLSVAIELDMELSEEAKARVAESISRAYKDALLNSKLEEAKEFLDKSKEILGSMTSFISGEYDREMTIEQNKTNALNQELNNRLLNENLSKDERAKIQNQIAQNDEKLRVKQESINRKKFNTEKAANIAMTLMNTATAAVGVMKDAKGGFFARLAQAIPTIAFGLAQVATIARTKYQSSAPASPANASIGSGGSGGGSGRAEPSFNIVGRSNENILLNAIQAQFDKPLKAYVVARDVTNQQQLDGIISNTSSI